jgi:hypothetical protein
MVTLPFAPLDAAPEAAPAAPLLAAPEAPPEALADALPVARAEFWCNFKLTAEELAADEALDELELEELLEDDALLEPPQALSASAPATAMVRNAEVFLTDAFIVLSFQGWSVGYHRVDAQPQHIIGSGVCVPYGEGN